MFDTHCHLNFQAFEGRVDRIIDEARKAGVTKIVVPGTDLETSKKAVEIAQKFAGVYAAVGIHPHHVYKLKVKNKKLKVEEDLKEIEKLLTNNKAVAVGEVGLDRHYYNKTKYADYQIDESFIELQKEFFLEQIKLANKYKKTLIIHNRKAKKDMLKILTDYRSLITDNPESS